MSSVSTRSPWEVAEHQYEAAEDAFLAGVRADRDRGALHVLASAVADQAEAWNRAEYDALHASSADYRREHDLRTERTEMLVSLWHDVARAYAGLPSLRDG